MNILRLLANTMAVALPLWSWALLPITYTGIAGAQECGNQYYEFRQLWPGTSPPTRSVRFTWTVNNTSNDTVPVDLSVWFDDYLIAGPGPNEVTVMEQAQIFGFTVEAPPNSTVSGVTYWACAWNSFAGGYPHSFRASGPEGTCTPFTVTVEDWYDLYPDDIEPNTDLNQTIITHADTGYTGRLAYPESDGYRIFAPDEGVLAINVMAEHAGPSITDSLYLDLKDNFGNNIISWRVPIGAGTTPLSSTYYYRCAGTNNYYHLYLRDITLCGASYRMSYTVDPPLYNDDVEPNDNLEQTIATSANNNYEGRLNFNYQSSFDGYRIQAPTDGLLTLTVWAAHAYDSTTDSLNFSLGDNFNNHIITWRAPIGANGVPASRTFTYRCTGNNNFYYLYTRTTGSCGASYRFSYAVTPPLYGDDPEPNDNLEQAIATAANTNYEGHLNFNYESSYDGYRIQAPTDGVLTLTVWAEHAYDSTTDSLNFSLGDNFNNNIITWRAPIGANGVPASRTFTYRCTGNNNFYYLYTGTTGSCGASYRFSYAVTPPLYGDDPEPNDNLEQTIATTANTNYEGHLNFNYESPSDGYRVYAPNDGVLNLTIWAEHASASATDSLNISLGDNFNTILQQWRAPIGANGSAASRTLTYRCSGDNNYYHLYIRSFNSCGVSYRFTYSVTQPLYADDVEPNQDPNGAALVDLGANPAFGHLSFGYDNTWDVFRVEHPGGVLSVTTSAESAGAAGTMTTQLRDLFYTPVAINTATAVGGSGVPAITTTQTAGPVAAGTYYIDLSSNSLCGVSYRINCYDDDNDGVCNASDLCPGTPGGEGVNSTGCACSQSVVDDGDACTVDQCVNGTITHTYQDTDGDGTCDASDGCATDANKTSPGTCGCGNPEPGATCNDGNPNTENDVIGSNCTCAGTPVSNTCTTDLALSFTKDATSQVDWYIHEQGTNIIVQHGSLTPGASTEEVNTCVPDGCYYLRVTDDAGDGIGGGYILRTSGNASRIIDNAANFNSGSTSQVAAGEGFCIPLGIDRLLGGSCDKFDWRNDEYVVATDNPSVTAVWNNFPSGSSQRANSGYEMWWYDPNGGYSFRRFQSHATTNGMAANAVRACHFRINSWSGNQLQATVLYNVKVRSRVLGTNSAWGPACRFVLDPARAQCPLTKLTDQAGQFFSCGATRNIGTSQTNLVHAQIAKKWVNNAWVNANRYQFRFTTDGGGSVITKTGNGNQYFVNTSGLQPCKTYQVDVRASFDGGATWCTAYPATNPYAPNWGPLCQLYTTGCPSNTGGGNQNVAVERNAPEMNLFPNPNNGEQLTLLLNGMDATVEYVWVEIVDTFGKRVFTRSFAVNDANLTANVRLNGELAAGMYLVNVVAGERTWTERVLIQP